MSGPGLNDFVIKIGTVNGTGSASANGLLMKSIFRMGIPVVGKNVFPSNIQGLPTWYEIRVSGDGHVGRSGEVHMMVAMNQATYDQDLAELATGGVLLYDSTWPRPQLENRPDVTVIGVPLMALAGFAVHQSVMVIRKPSATAQVTVARLFDVEIAVGLAGATVLAVAKGPTPQTLGVGAFVALAVLARLGSVGATLHHWRRVPPPSVPSG